MRADLERSLKTRLLMHTESLNGAEEEEQEDKVNNLLSLVRMRYEGFLRKNCLNLRKVSNIPILGSS